MESSKTCKACGDPLGDSSSAEYCRECYDELTKGKIPNGITDSRLHPPGTGQVPWQQIGRTKTGG